MLSCPTHTKTTPGLAQQVRDIRCNRRRFSFTTAVCGDVRSYVGQFYNRMIYLPVNLMQRSMIARWRWRNNDGGKDEGCDAGSKCVSDAFCCFLVSVAAFSFGNCRVQSVCVSLCMCMRAFSVCVFTSIHVF